MANKTLKKILKPGERKKKQKLAGANAVKKLVAYIETNCLDLEGICRISGNAIRVKELAKQLENEEDVDLSKIPDKHTVSGALKMFLREMDEPILTFDLYKNFLGGYDIRDRNAKISFFKSLLSALPKDNYDTLQLILKLLYTLQLYHEKNKMTSGNLAIVFAPTLLRPKEESLETMMNSTNYTTEIVKCLIEEFNVLFELNNTPILYKLKSSELIGKEKTVQEQLEEAKATIESLLKQASEEANERAVLETYANQTNNRLQEEIELRKMTIEEKEGLSELCEELKEKSKSVEEKNKLQSQEIDELKKKLEETNNKQTKLDTESTSNLIPCVLFFAVASSFIAAHHYLVGEMNKSKVEIESQCKLLKVDLEKQTKMVELEKKKVKELEDHAKVNENEQKKKSKELEDQIVLLKTSDIEQKKKSKELEDQMVLLKKENTTIITLKQEAEKLTRESKLKSDQLLQITKERDDFKIQLDNSKNNNNNKKGSSSSSSSQQKEIDNLTKKLKESETKNEKLEKELKEKDKQLAAAHSSSTSTTSTTVSSASFVIGKKPVKDTKKETKTKEKAPTLQDEDDIMSVKQFAFYWMITSVKTDAMLHGKNCNIISSEIFDELLAKRTRVNQWQEVINKKLSELN
ncbi:RhoGAP domain-containing protein [Cavenderia fasciculata]|uniref:RhoGAP domain-containing protein n=1 Tax=Cavenderia fasciculata TaxID=261658 RepID=F4PXX3_CACFS|nr:RhoGAP domain-containing protein [Cavenderia fasciculata]EGG19633.1 RhoGAP domain-containing protein [Cavenderia fasciculata]|eukprot:XP_004357927.1 RhoGAP domain-containing protein [Cavenderia fasciculata]